MTERADVTASSARWPEEFRELRNSCPRAWSKHHGGYWVASRFDDVIRIAQNPEAFTSGKVVGSMTTVRPVAEIVEEFRRGVAASVEHLRSISIK